MKTSALTKTFQYTKVDVMLNSLYLIREVDFASRYLFFATVKLIKYIRFYNLG